MALQPRLRLIFGASPARVFGCMWENKLSLGRPSHTHTPIRPVQQKETQKLRRKRRKKRRLVRHRFRLEAVPTRLGVKGPGDPDRSVRSFDAERRRRVNSGCQSEESGASDQSLFHTAQTDSRPSAHPSVIRLRLPFAGLLSVAVHSWHSAQGGIRPGLFLRDLSRRD